MNLSVGLIYNLIFIALLVVVTIVGMRRGFLASMLGLGGTVASVMGAVWASRTWAPEIYTKYFGTLISKRVTEAVAGQGANAGDVVQQYAGFLPESVQNSLTLAIQNAATTGSDTIGSQVTAALQPMILPLIQALLFIVIVLLLRAIFKMMGKMLRGVNHVPVLGPVNRTLGFCFGLVTGTLDCWLLSIGLWLAASATTGSIAWLSAGALGKSEIYTFLTHFNPFLTYYA